MMAIFFLLVYLLLCFKLKADEVPPLPRDVLHNSYTGRPVCAFFKHAATPPDLENMLSTFLKSNVALKNYAEWIIGSVNLEDIEQVSPPPYLYPSMVPSIQCDVGLPLPEAFIFHNKNIQSLRKWFKVVAKKHLKQPKTASMSSLEMAIFNNSKGITILLVPGLQYFQYMEDMMSKVDKNQINLPLELLVSKPESENDRKLQELFGIKETPAVLFFTHEVWVEKTTFTCKLQGLQGIQPGSIQLALNTIKMNAVFLDETSFRNDILDTKYQLPPKLVCFFSYLNPNSLKYILGFEEIKKQLECEGAALEFRLMNIGEKNNSQVFSRYINATSVKSFPVFVLFWQEITSTYEILTRQEVLDGIPSTHELYAFLIENGILDESNSNNNGECFSEEHEHLLECVNHSHSGGTCETNLTIVNEFFVDTYYSSADARKIVGKEKKRRLWDSRSYTKTQKIGNLTVLTDDNWSAVVETSSWFSSTKTLHTPDDISPVLNLIIFIIKDCRYCQIVMPSLEKLAQAIRLIDRAALHLVNCSSSPAICERYNVQGYPSMKLFRSIPWFEVEGCLTDQRDKQCVIQDFHQPFEPHQLVLEWLSNSSLPVAKKEFLLKDVPDKLDHDVYLVGTVITRPHALRFLPPSTRNKWYSLKCFQAACELLFGKAVCYVTMTKDFGIDIDMAAAKNKDTFLIKATLFRRDGVQARVFELGVPLQTTMLNEKDSKLHQFHNAHRYDLPKEFRCEDNHPLCTELIVKYVTDHSRLPVTRLSHYGFHTMNRFSNNGVTPTSVPVVVVLAHKENLTSGSSYFQNITKAANELYRDIIFTALDVDEYPWWANRFVPKDYESTQFLHSSGVMPMSPLYHFPRICVVIPTDHNQAVFFPSLKAMVDAENVPKLLETVTAKDIVEFVKNYLRHPKDNLVKTEIF